MTDFEVKRIQFSQTRRKERKNKSVTNKILNEIYSEMNFQFSQFAKIVLGTIKLIMERDFPDSYRRDDFKLAKNESFSSLEKKLKIFLQA